ncbi:ATP synthase F1 subunit delta [Sedimentisphaera salicampi]|uniref:ATP synthase subunit delta n=1 Tax=Sedimentisphaera salicampi TaxID=1941349 RepID=A0A1W6LK51_9BACT|nr:ATP synthase F1 subunit delta [Sedimentisphaera salicampi]ARN56135.1 F-type ATPase subunit delta [Sedimentisphaera salicampi]OXU15704.1 F-type ATPase subunit delta [Sedimentisphaera salicampi]
MKDFSATAEIYAKPFFEIAEENGKIQLLFSELEVCADSFSRQKDVLSFFDSPFVQTSEKIKAAESALAGKADNFTTGLIVSLARRGRIGLLPEIIKAFEVLEAKSRGVEFVKLTLASEPSEDIREHIEKRLKEAIGKETRFEYQFDPDLIGGVVIEHNGKVVDNSVRNNLNKAVNKITGSIRSRKLKSG